MLLAEATIVHDEPFGLPKINPAAMALRTISPMAAKAQTVDDGTVTSGIALPVQKKSKAGAKRSA